MRQIAGQRHLRGALVTTLVTSTLCGPLIIFCPVLVKEVLHGDVSDFSIAIGAFGVGGLLGAAALLGVNAELDRRRLSSWFAAGYGAIVALAAVNPWSWGLPALLVLAGLSMSVSNTSANSFFQATAPSATARPDRQSLYACDARRALGRRAYDRYIDRLARGALCLTDQWNSGADDAAFCRARMDMFAITEGFDVTSQSSSCLLRVKSGH